jgi:hypothetical protein
VNRKELTVLAELGSSGFGLQFQASGRNEMTFRAIRAVVLIAITIGCSYSLFKDAVGGGERLGRVDRGIRFIGAILMLAVAIGGSLLVAGYCK